MRRIAFVIFMFCVPTIVFSQQNISGRIVNTEGQPIPKAKVVLYHNHSRWGLGNRIVEENESAADGSFILKSPLDYSDTGRYPYGRDSFVLLASHPDYALSWVNISKGQEKSRYELTLTSPTTFTITVTNLADNPLPGARLWSYSMGDVESSNPAFRDYLSLPTDIGLVGATTDARGRATVTNLPKTGCSFYATLKGYAKTLAFPGQETIRLTPGATVTGTVLTEDSKAVEGAIVRFRADWMWQFFLTKTDSQGRFRLEDLPAVGWDMSAWGRGGVGSGIYSITMEHDDYTTWQAKVQLEQGQKLENFIIDAYPGTLINCRVLETETNHPVGGARINGQNESGRIDGYSDPNGLFRIRVTPGQTRLIFFSPPEGVYLEGGLSLQRDDLPESNLNFYAEGDQMDVTLKTPRIAGLLTSVHGIVLGPDGSAQADAVVHAATDSFQRAGGGYIPPVGADVDGHFELKDVPAGRRISLFVITKDRLLAGTAECDVPTGSDKAPFVQIKLQDTKVASVIIKDTIGSALENKTLQINPVVAGHRMPRAQRSAKTDEQGLLEIDGILLELQYFLRETRRARTPSIISRSNYIEPFEKTMVLVSSETESVRQKITMGIQPRKKFFVTLPNGVTVELVGLFTGQSKEELTWWRPDGRVMDESEYAEYLVQIEPEHIRHRDDWQFEYGYLLRFTPSENVSTMSDVTIGTKMRYMYPRKDNICLGIVESYVAQQEKDLPKISDIMVAAACGPYKSFTSDREPGRDTDHFVLEDGSTICLSGAWPDRYQSEDGLMIATTFNADDLDVSLSFQSKKDGNKRKAQSHGTSGGPSLVSSFQAPKVLIQETFRLPMIQLEDIERIIVEYRRFQPVTFKNVALRPSVETEVQIECEKVGDSLMNQPLFTLEEFGISVNARVLQDKYVLICFWDLEQRPSRNCMMQLSQKAQELKGKDIVIVAVHASKIDKSTLDDWVKKNKIPFAVGTIQGDEEKIHQNWGIRSLPWLIFTDKKQAVRAEGFSITELDQKIGELENVEQ